MIFGEDQRSPAEHLRLHFAAVAKLPVDDQRTVIDVIEGLILKSEARRWDSARAVDKVPAGPRDARAAAG